MLLDPRQIRGTPDVNPDDPSNPQYLIDHFYAGSGETGEGGSANWSFTNGTLSNINNEVGHPGMILLQTGTTANLVHSFYLASNAATTTMRMDEWARMCWIFAPSAISADCAYQVGMMAAFGALLPAHGIYLERLAADANWFFVSRNNGVQTRVDTGVVLDLNWVKVNFRRVSAASVGFRINNSAEVFINTNIPDAGDSFNVGLQRTPTGIIARNMKLDFFSMKSAAIAT